MKKILETLKSKLIPQQLDSPFADVVKITSAEEKTWATVEQSFALISDAFGKDPEACLAGFEKFFHQSKKINPYYLHYLNALFIELAFASQLMWPDLAKRSRSCFGLQTQMSDYNEEYLNRIQRWAEQQIERNGESPHPLCALGYCAFVRGDKDAAYAHFFSAATCASSTGAAFQRMFSGANSINLPRSDSPAFFENEVEWVTTAPQGDAVVLIGCDLGYWKGFGGDFLKSLEGKRDLSTHVHLALRKDESVPDMPGGVGVSVEVMPVEYDTTAFTLLRFVRLDHILRRYNVPVLVSDIDVEFRSTAEKLCAHSRQADVTFNVHIGPSSQAPWRVFHGTSTLITPNSRGYKFAEMLNDYIRHTFQHGLHPHNWWYDQLALFDVSQALIKQDPEITYRQFDKVPVRRVNNAAADAVRHAGKSRKVSA